MNIRPPRLAVAAWLACWALGAAAQATWPRRTIALMVPCAAGGSTGSSARDLAHQLRACPQHEGAQACRGSGADFARILATELAAWKKTVVDAGIQAQ
jgi:tripartite-type tricarboxylate transporter receptor subunit TctC